MGCVTHHQDPKMKEQTEYKVNTGAKIGGAVTSVGLGAASKLAPSSASDALKGTAIGVGGVTALKAVGDQVNKKLKESSPQNDQAGLEANRLLPQENSNLRPNLYLPAENLVSASNVSQRNKPESEIPKPPENKDGKSQINQKQSQLNPAEGLNQKQPSVKGSNIPPDQSKLGSNIPDQSKLPNFQSLIKKAEPYEFNQNSKLKVSQIPQKADANLQSGLGSNVNPSNIPPPSPKAIQSEALNSQVNKSNLQPQHQGLAPHSSKVMQSQAVNSQVNKSGFQPQPQKQPSVSPKAMHSEGVNSQVNKSNVQPQYQGLPPTSPVNRSNIQPQNQGLVPHSQSQAVNSKVSQSNMRSQINGQPPHPSSNIMDKVVVGSGYAQHNLPQKASAFQQDQLQYQQQIHDQSNDVPLKGIDLRVSKVFVKL